MGFRDSGVEGFGDLGFRILTFRVRGCELWLPTVGVWACGAGNAEP